MKKFLLLLILIPGLLICQVNLETPEDALDSILNSTKGRNLRQFLQCTDLQAFAGIPNSEENIERILLSIKNDSLRRGYVNKTLDYLATHSFEIYQTLSGTSTTTFLIQEKNGRSRAKLLFRRFGDEWRLAGFKQLAPAPKDDLNE